MPSLTASLTPETEEVRMSYGMPYPAVAEVSLQAVYTDDTLYIRAVWADD